MSSHATLSVRTIFGVKGSVANNVVFADEGSVVFPAASFLVRHAIASRASDYAPITERSLGVTAMAMSPSRRFLAIAEVMSNGPTTPTAISSSSNISIEQQISYFDATCQLSIYNSKTMAKRKQVPVLPADLAVGAKIVALSFSNDDQLLAVLGSEPNFNVGVYSLERCDLVAKLYVPPEAGLGAPAAQVRPISLAFAPVFGGKLCVWGRNAFSFFSLIEKNPGAAPPEPVVGEPKYMTHSLVHVPHSQSFHAWADPRMTPLFEMISSNSSSASTEPSGTAVELLANAMVAEHHAASESHSSLIDEHSHQDHGHAENSEHSDKHNIITEEGGREEVHEDQGNDDHQLLQENLNAPSSSFSADGVNITAFCWLTPGTANRPELNVAATRQGELLLFYRDELLRVLASSPLDSASCIDILCSTPSGGFVGAGEGGKVYIFDQQQQQQTTDQEGASLSSSGEGGATHRTTSSRQGTTSSSLAVPSDEYFRRSKTLSASIPGLECEDRIRSLSVNPSGKSAVLALSGTQLLLLDLASAHLKDDSSAFTTVGAPSHAPPVGQSASVSSRNDLCAIGSMSVAVRKPLIATVGADNTVRVWNFIDKTLEICKVYPDGPCSVSLHPSGLQILIGFADRLRLMNVLPDDFREMNDFPVKSCSESRFSRGGHLFAAANGNVIQVYSSFTGEYLLTLRGHSGKILSIQWAYNDATLLSLATDGAIYEWDLKDGKRSREFMLKGAKFTSVTATRDGSTIYAVGDGGLVNQSDGNYSGHEPALREINFDLGTVTREWLLPSHSSSVSLSCSKPPFLFSASADPNGLPSTIRSYSFPLPMPNGTAPAPGVEFAALSSPATRITPSFDDAYLFVTGDDGSIVVFEAKDQNQRVPLSENAGKLPWAEEALVTAQDLEERRGTVRELREALSELQGTSQYNLRTKEVNFQEAVRKETQRATSELEQLRAQCELVSEEMDESEVEFSERLAGAESAHRAEMQKRESLYQTKIMDEVEKYQSLQQEVASQKTRWQVRRTQATESHAQAVQRLMAEFERKLEAVRGKRAALEEELSGGKRDWTEMRSQMESDLDEEALTVRKMYQERVDAERDASLKYKGENGIMRKKFSAVQQDIEASKDAVKVTLERHDGLRRQIDSLERDVANLRSHIRDRDATIGEREKRIYELKKKNQELEKFKFVLDYKIKELKAQVEPRELEITALKQQVKEVDTELEAYHKSNADLDKMIGTLRKDLDEFQEGAKNLRSTLSKRDDEIKSFSGKLFQTVSMAKEPKDWVAGAEALYAAHVPANLPVAAGDISVIAESERQKEHLESLFTELKKTGAANEISAKAASAHLVEENLSLIEQIKTLRSAAADYRLQLKTIAVNKARVALTQKAAELKAASRERSVVLARSSVLSQAKSPGTAGSGFGAGLSLGTPRSGTVSPPRATTSGSLVTRSSPPLKETASPAPASSPYTGEEESKDDTKEEVDNETAAIVSSSSSETEAAADSGSSSSSSLIPEQEQQQEIILESSSSSSSDAAVTDADTSAPQAEPQAEVQAEAVSNTNETTETSSPSAPDVQETTVATETIAETSPATEDAAPVSETNEPEIAPSE